MSINTKLQNNYKLIVTMVISFEKYVENVTVA
jgi:hypothetical protein